MSRVWGQYRADAAQRFPGDALMGAQGLVGRIAVWRFRHVPDAAEAPILTGLQAIYDGKSGTAQVRLFRAAQPDGTDFIGIVELRAGTAIEADVSLFGDVVRYLDQMNVYVPYTRRIAGAFPKGT